MSLLALVDAKAFLDVIHDADDEKLQLLLDGAEDEALQFMDRATFGEICPDCVSDLSPSEPEVMPPSVKIGVLLLLQAKYQAAPDDIGNLRKVAETLLMPYRCRIGV